MLEPGSQRWSKPASILIATDLGDIDRLFPFALSQARENGSRLFLLHVLTATNSISVDPGGLPYYNPNDAVEHAEKFLSSYCKEAREANIQCQILIREGSAAQQILATVAQFHVDRILLATRSRGKWGKLLLGSVAEQVLRSAPVPVLTVGPEVSQDEGGAASEHTVLHATSLNITSSASAALACEVARASGARLLLMHVLAPSRDDEVADVEAREHAQLQLQALMPADLACQCASSARVVRGNIAIEILAEAVASHATLIVLGAANSSPMGAMAREGTVYRVLAHARCPVLTIRERRSALRFVQHKEGFAVKD